MRLPANIVGFNFRVLTASDTERVGDAVDVIEPRRDQSDLQNRLIVKAVGAKFFVPARMNFRRVFGELHDVIAHHALGFGNRRVFVIGF